MVLNWVEFKNNDINLSIDRVNFNKGISLLVGLTGSGKSQIISAIEILIGIATTSTDSFQSISGSISFSVSDREYIWTVSTIHCEEDDNSNEETTNRRMNYCRMMYYDAKTTIESESLTCNGEIVFIRNDKTNYIAGFSEIPPCDNTRSYISIFKKEEKLHDVFVSFLNVFQIWFLRPAAYKVNVSYIDDRAARFSFLSEFRLDRERYNASFPKGYDLISKIRILLDTNINLWEEILANYRAIFNEVDDITIGPCLGSKEAVTIYFQIGDTKIDIGNISSGMVKSLQLITDVFTASYNNVVIIDELENGYGINCIDSVWDIIKKCSYYTQFVLTSHHPYVISNLDYRRLLIVQRNGNNILTCTGQDFKLGETHHDYYDAIFNRLIR